jgi:hypothetical protein
LTLLRAYSAAMMSAETPAPEEEESGNPGNPGTPGEAATDTGAAAPPPPPLSPAARRGLLLAVVVLGSLLFGGWGAWRAFAPAPEDARGQISQRDRQLGAQRRQLAELEQRVATLSRSDQISRDAMRDLQSTLAERDEEIAALRADVDFYERFVGATAQRRGLTVHELKLQSRGDNVWHFTATLTQNLNRGVVNNGELRLAVEGTLGGRLQRLDWPSLRQQADAEGIEYSFRYFEQIEGDLVLPQGMRPVRIHARLVPEGGRAVEQSFPWEQATSVAPAGAAR